MNVIERVKQILKPQKEYPNFHGTNWKPMDQMVIKDLDLKAKIENDGYAVVSILDQSLIESLTGIYKNHHSKETENGGMFYSLYSQDINYRKKVNDELEAQLKSTYESLFVDYKTVINSFIIKYPGPKSEFYLHQDSTGLNEWKHSPVSVWMPLQETTVDNGCMWVVPGSHKWFSPYRGIAFPSMFEAHQDMLRPYLKPITVNLGEVLLFDNRIVHLSGANLSTHPRVIVMSGIFPKQAELIACYRDVANQGPLEVFGQDEDFLLKNLNFYIDCTARPKLGSKIAECKKVKYDYSECELRSLLEKYAGEKNDQYQYDLSNVSCDIIEEPV
jgi:hypothetical protein